VVGLDVLLAWFARKSGSGMAAAYCRSSTGIRDVRRRYDRGEKAGLVVRGLGIMMTIAVLGSLVLRGWWYLRPRSGIVN